MLHDFVFGFRLLLKQRAFAAAALLTLALCIGANTAIFTVLENVILRGLPFPDPSRLVTMYNIYPGVGVSDRGANGVPDYLDRRKMTNVFSEVALTGNTGYDVGLEGSPQRIDGANVTPSYFAVLGVRPLLGRTFTEEEATLGKEQVAVLSEGLWKDLFARDPNVVGKDIRLSGTLYRVVGVMPGSFGIPGAETRIWTALAFTQEQTGPRGRHTNQWGMIARLRPGVSLAQAQERIDDLNRRNLDLFPEFKQLLINARFGTRVLGLKDELVRDIRPTLYLLQIAVGVVLLIGCVNLANLMLVRSNVRMKELAVRYSLGAGRWRLARHLLAESVLLALMGGALGTAVAYAGVRLLVSLGARELPRGAMVAIDGGALLFTAAVAVVTGLVFGSVPLFHVFGRDLSAVFRGTERAGTSGSGVMWVRSALIVCQFAFAFVLLIGAGLLTMSFNRLLMVDPGFRPDNTVTARISLPRVRYGEDPQVRSLLSRLLERMASAPGVRHAGLTTFLPFGGSSNASVVMFPSHPLGPGENPPVPGWNTASGAYFQAMGIPLLEGRTFSYSDGPDSPKVAIIDEFLARKYFPKGNAIGAVITRGILVPGDSRRPDDCTIVGVVGSVKVGDLAESNPLGQVYFSFTQYPPRNMHLVLRADHDNPQLISSLRRELQQADPELPLFDARSMPERMAASLQSRRAAMILCLVFAGLSVLLAAIGIYGVLAYSVSERTRELGIRAALGAGVRELVGMVVGQGLRMAAFGLALGAVGAFAVTRLMTAQLYGVRPTDPGVFVAVALVLAMVACAASLIPAARAVRIPPSSALRYE